MLRKMFGASVIKALAALSLLVMSATLTRVLSIEDMSQYLMLNAAVLLVINIGSWGAPQLVLRKTIETCRDIAAVRRVILFYGGVVFVNGVIVAVIYLMVQHFWVGVHVDYLWWVGVIFWVALGAVIRVVAEGYRGIGWLHGANMLAAVNSHGLAVTVMSIAMISLLAAMGCDISLAVVIVISVISLVVTLGGAVVRLVLVGGEQLSSKSERLGGEVVKVFTSGSFIIVAQLCVYLITQGDIWFASLWADQNELAHYGIASRTAFLAAFALIALNASVSHVVKNFRENGCLDYVHSQIQKGVMAASAFALIALAVCMLRGEYLLEIAYGDEYSGAVNFLLIFIAGHLVSAITGPCGIFLLMLGYERQVFFITVGVFICYIAIVLLIGSTYGAAGVAVSSAVAFSATNILYMIVLKYKTGIYTGIQLRVG